MTITIAGEPFSFDPKYPDEAATYLFNSEEAGLNQDYSTGNPKNWSDAVTTELDDAKNRINSNKIERFSEEIIDPLLEFRGADNPEDLFLASGLDIKNSINQTLNPVGDETPGSAFKSQRALALLF